MQTCIRPSWCHCHLLSLASVKSRLIFTFLVLAHPSSPEKRAIKRARVCMYFYGRSSFDKVYHGCSFFIQCRIRLILHCYIILYQLLPMRCYASLCSLATADICFLIPDHPCLLWINSHVVVCNVDWFFLIAHDDWCMKVMLIFLQNMSLLLNKTPPADIRNHVLPMIARALEANQQQIQVQIYQV